MDAPLATASAESATAGGALGLYPAGRFRTVVGASADGLLRQARWYFRDETIAVPVAGLPVASFSPGVRTFDDVRQWAAARASDAPIDYPPLVWLGAPHVIHGGRLSAEGTRIERGATKLEVRPVAKIPLNRSYYDASSAAFLAPHRLTVRGTHRGGDFEMRTVWPDDFRLGGAAPPPRGLPSAASPALAVRALMREAPKGGAQSPYAAWTLWQRDAAARDWSGRPVLALMVNGAQGDDDEAHGGHFALVTGRIEPDGRVGGWLVNNFYSLDIESEKGILAAPVPLDNYLGDLNSGQNWYRPSYLLVLVLRHARAAELVQSALNRVYNQLYRHQLAYYHPNENCTSMSVDTLRALGWPVPERGPSSRLRAWLGFPVIALKERSIAKAKLAFDYLVTDQARLLPAAALESMCDSIFGLIDDRLPEGSGTLARMLCADVDALAFMRVPQFPSSRAFGDAPAVSTKEYQARVPKDPARVQIVPVPPRPFPEALRDPDLIAPRRHPSDYAALAWGALSVAGALALIRRATRRK